MATILVSYRRKDTAPLVGRLSDQLKAYYGSGNVFLDIDDIPPGVDFHAELSEKLAHTDVVIAVIGSQWCGSNEIQSRIQDADDPVRLEVEGALTMGVSIVPVLADGAKMPARPELPASLAQLPSINAVSISSGVDYHYDVERLISALNRILGAKAPIVGRAAFSSKTMRQPLIWAPLVVLGLPFLIAGLGFAPPWPPGLAAIAAAIQAMAIAGIIVIFPMMDRRSLKRLLVTSGACLVVFGSAYLAMQSAFVFQAPTTGERFVKGFVCTSDAMRLYKAKCPFLGQDELQGAEYEAERLWTLPSIALVRITLDLLWIVSLVAMSIFAAFVAVNVLRERRRINDPGLV